MFIFKWIKKFFSAIDWACLFVLRFLWRTIQVAVVIGIVIGLGALFKNTSPLPANSVLVLDLKGSIVEQVEPTSLPMTLLAGEEPQETALHDVLGALDKAKRDPMIKGVFLKLDKLDRVGLASLKELGRGIDQFKQSGKPVWAWGSHFSQTQYAIASHAREIYMHPMGEVSIKGLSSNRLYYGDLLKSLGVNVHVFKAGAYKSYPETFTNNAPSDVWIEGERTWLNSAWSHLSTDIERSRGLMPGSIKNYIDSLPETVRNNRGDMAQTALSANFIDGLKTYDEIVGFIESKLGKDKSVKAALISYLDYAPEMPVDVAPQSVAIVVADGQILDGESEPGIIGAESINQQLDLIREDPNIKAVVFRINSPGGSAVASEYIRHGLERIKKAGKPVVISMGDVAASGGYWISMGGTKVIASPTTITGSIGVFGLTPTFEKTLSLAKIGQGSVSTTWLAGADKSIRALDPRLEDILTQNVARTYGDFTNLVAKSRKLTVAKVQTVAQGRVWTGEQALQNHLVDRLGYFEDAITEARQLAKLPATSPVVFFSDASVSLSATLKSSMKRWTSPLSWLNFIQMPTAVRTEQQFWSEALQRPRDVYAHSLVNID